MAVNTIAFKEIQAELDGKATLVAVSKIKPVSDIQKLYDLGQRDFGENYVQELVDKATQLPKDIRWHFIGHLQSNKVKYIASFVHLIHGVDSLKLLQEINKQASKHGRIIDVLLQVHIAEEETKFGFDATEISTIFSGTDWKLPSVRICGLMGMGSFSDDMNKVRSEFKKLKELYDSVNSDFTTLSMGMSSDYKMAVEEGSTMVRVGSLLFGVRNYNQSN